MAKKIASGMYKTKARNLTDAQLKRAKGAKAAGKRTVSVSSTSRATTGANKGYTLGAGGKRLTGTVVMANGDRAVYKGGKRVTNVPKVSVKKAATASRPSSSGISSAGSKVTGLSLAQKAKLLKDKKVSSGMGGKTSSSGGMGAEGPKRSTPKPAAPSSGGYSIGGFNIPAGSKASTPKKTGPQKGDRKRAGGPYGGYLTYNGSKWVKS